MSMDSVQDSFAFVGLQCPWVPCRRTALPSQECTVSMGSVQKDSSAFEELHLHCVHGFCEGQLCCCRIALCPWILCRTALLLQNCIVSMDSVKDSFAAAELHCVHGFCAGQLCLCRITLCPWILCRTALPSESFIVSMVTV